MKPGPEGDFWGAVLVTAPFALLFWLIVAEIGWLWWTW
jgi:hypothetical protein